LDDELLELLDERLREHNEAHPDDQLHTRADLLRRMIAAWLRPARSPDRRQLRSG
jgi:hypothetical protein